MTKAEFLRWQSDGNYVYEYNDGLLEPTTSTRRDEHYLLTNLKDYPGQTDSSGNKGRLRAEMGVWVAERPMRRPDVAYYTNEQIRRMNNDEKVIPGFFIEFSFDSDDVQKNSTKRHKYVEASSQLV